MDLADQVYGISKGLAKTGFNGLSPNTSRYITGYFFTKNDRKLKVERKLVDVLEIYPWSEAVVRDRKDGVVYTLRRRDCQVVEEEVFDLNYEPKTSEHLELCPFNKDVEENGWYTYFCQKYGANNVLYRAKNGWYRFLDQIWNNAYNQFGYEMISVYGDNERLVEVCLAESFEPKEGIHTEQGNTFAWKIVRNLNQTTWSTERTYYRDESWITKEGKFCDSYREHYTPLVEREQKQYQLEADILSFKLMTLKDFIEKELKVYSLPGKFFVKQKPGAFSYLMENYNVSFSAMKTLQQGLIDQIINFIFMQNYAPGTYNWNQD
jgi:hypothetical protein